VSETLLPKDETPAASHEPSAPPPVVKRRSNGLAVVALLLAAAGLAAAGWGVWQVRSLTSGHLQQSQRLESLSAQTLTLQQSERKLSADLAQLPGAAELEERRRLVAQLQGDQQRLSQRLETVLGASRKDWRLAEAEHLLRLASLRLSALQDIHSAQALVRGADEILREQDDPGAYAAREQLTKSLAALSGVEQPDRTGVFLQLAALRDQAVQLTALAPEFEAHGDAVRATGTATESRWREWWDKISSYFRVDFNPDADVRPLLAGQGLNQVRLALSLGLEQAQWAALNGEAKVYKQALEEARSILVASFNQDNVQAKAILEQIDQLKARTVTVVTPDLAASIEAVQAYLQRRHTPVDGLDTPAAGQPAEASQ